MQREKNIWLVCFQREEYWCGMGSRRETRTWRRTPPHPTTTFNQRRKAWPRPSTPASTSAIWWAATAAPLTSGCSSTYPLRSHPIDALRVQTVFLEEEAPRRERRVTSSRTKFWKLSGGREDEGYKGNTRTFWKVLLLRREF